MRHAKRKYGSKKGYLYAKQLSFLSETYKQNTLSGSDGEDNNDDNWGSDSDDNKVKHFYKNGSFETKEEPTWQNDDESMGTQLKKRKTDIEFVETNYPEVPSRIAIVDEDKSFFDSLLPAVKQFTIDQKLELRSDILKLIKQYRKDARSSRLQNDWDQMF